MSSIVLLTGATGFLGTQIARRLVARSDATVVALVRAEDWEAAAWRLSRSWWEWPELASAIGTRVEVLPGDVASPRLGLDETTYAALTGRLTHIIHTAADLRLDGPLDALRRTNVQGTANVLALARAAHDDHGLARFAHVSTAYVAGGRTGPVPEEALSAEFGFSNAYELSKYEGECLVRAARNQLPVSVFRPGMIVGDSRSGAIKTFNTVYFPLRLYLAGKLRVIPADAGLPVNIIPVDYVAAAIARLTFDPSAEGLTFHLTAPLHALPRTGELVEFVREWAGARLGVRPARPLYIPLPALRGRYRPTRASRRRAPGRLDALLSLLPYFNERLQFRRDNVDRILGPYEMEWREFLPSILEYAVSKSFMHRADRTVHEQILSRLESKGRRVTYHDVVAGKVVTRGAAEMRREILAAAQALRAMGIRPGDRVAIVGLNSTRYLALDVAIGLVGAVSVPLYYTSPPADLDPILAASGARLLLVGAPALLERLGELTVEAPVVTFCRDPLPARLPQRVVRWDDFLALGASGERFSAAPVGFGDVATLRYTSGTTGRPKGVVFRHENLRWIGETIASLIPWKARIAAARYLSFLPMNHVVEGILGIYSPYYLPVPLDIYFLEDFKNLRRALPTARPTVFFSVPRVYEKVWETFERSRTGRFYLRLEPGLVRALLRPLLRRFILRRAGLDRSVQLLVGSAPASEALLHAFRELGIEIYNAYGLTEAPLVTVNRMGANRIGTAGTPLPETEVCVAEDGEILVRGPQVTPGYCDEGVEQPFRDGRLLTGDLGHLTPEGSLVIEGRKKELIATSYGKKIHPAKVEALLREIPGVVEAMLVGEGRPFCVALLWVNGDPGDQTLKETIGRAVEVVNRRLSHPEQVKRWTILANDLSLEGGDLTANLKLKRQAVARRLQQVVEELYEDGPAALPDGRPDEAAARVAERLTPQTYAATSEPDGHGR